DFTATYRRLLARQGCRIVETATRQAALEAIRTQPFALVVADLRLPDGDGLDIVRAARATPQPPAVIVVTGFGSEAKRRQALEAGASAYLPKPFAVSAFISLVEQTLGPVAPTDP
ncbi:MAG: response regulator, partial [Candidatus Rokubacteria bacterium]|nr:response regulator [Candidatus Rokubacteria bacterium]